MYRWAKKDQLFPGVRFQLERSISMNLQCCKKEQCAKSGTQMWLRCLRVRLELGILRASCVIDSTFLDYCLVIFSCKLRAIEWNSISSQGACVTHAGRAVLQPVTDDAALGLQSLCRKGSGGNTLYMLPRCLLSLLCPNGCHPMMGWSKMERSLQLCVFLHGSVAWTCFQISAQWFCEVFLSIIHQTSGCKAVKQRSNLCLWLSSPDCFQQPFLLQRLINDKMQCCWIKHSQGTSLQDNVYISYGAGSPAIHLPQFG